MKKRNLVILILFLCAGCVTLRGPQKQKLLSLEGEQKIKRLYDHVRPLHYDLSLNLDPAAQDFLGELTIRINIEKSTHDFALHAQDIDFSYLALKSNNKIFPVKYVKVDSEGYGLIKSKNKLNPGIYNLVIKYKSKFKDDLMGLYKLRDKNSDYLYTQFEPISARSMLPCFDEPRFKSTFSLKVTVPAGNHVIANAPEEKIEDYKEKKTYFFKESAPMPTYLLALAVGPFDIVKSTEKLNFRGIAVKGKGKELAFAMKESPVILQKLEDYFGLPYPFEKLDILAVPDFRAGAMENLGAITFREWYLLLDKDNASTEQKRGFYLVMAHELAHQWFGNLVSVPWWNDLWLNEAFATWLSYKIVDELKPEFKVGKKLLARAHEAMENDSLEGARKIREPIVSSNDIHSAFDNITYDKGGALLNNLESFLGEEKFRLAVSDYIKRFSHAHATSADFLTTLAFFAGKDLVKSANSFLNQNAVPTVEASYSCKDFGFKLALKQEPFSYLGSKQNKEKLWEIPLCVGFEENNTLKKHCLVLTKKSEVIDIKTSQCPKFIMPNWQSNGYYKFSLNHLDWKNLLAVNNNLDQRDYLAIADSLLAELYSGHLDFSFVAENLLAIIPKAPSLVLGHFIRLMEEADNYWIDKEHKNALKDYARNALIGMFNNYKKKTNLNLEDRQVLRDVGRYLAYKLNDQEARAYFIKMGDRYLSAFLKKDKNFSDNNEDLLADALAISLREHDDAYISQVLERLKSEEDSLKRRNILYGLALSRRGERADIIRNLIFDGSLRQNEKLSLFYDQLEDQKNQPATWNFVKSKWPELNAYLKKPQIANLPLLAEGLCSQSYAKEVEEFFSPIIAAYEGGPRNLSEVVEKIKVCADRKHYAAKFANHFFAERSVKRPLTLED
jgi:alanyl aminopeptidase